MTPPACGALLPGPSVYFVSVNTTYALYSCRSGYRYLDGDYNRSCDSSGNWTGQALQCIVDSVMPKTYLVILIVGATIAIFVACIPYDFYRYRKRKQKVRDHQERLSLVTRIAPSHATVILDTDTNASKSAPEPPRKFGLKSLFSVFRFVGGKMKTAGEEDSKSNAKSDNGKGKSICEEASSDGACGAATSSSGNGSGGSGAGGSVNASVSAHATESGCNGKDSGVNVQAAKMSCSFSSGDGSVNADMPVSSSLLLDPHHSSGCPGNDDDAIYLCGSSSYDRCDNQPHLTSDETSDDFDRHNMFEKGRITGSLSSGNSSCSFSNGKIIPNTNSRSGSRSVTPPNHSTTSSTSINSIAFRNAVKKSNTNTSLASRKSKASGKYKMNRSVEKISNSNPATVEVTPISSANSSSSFSSSKTNEDPSFPVYLPPPPLPSSSSSTATAASSSMSSSSSPNLCREVREDRSRTFQHHVQTGTGDVNSSHPYHSMPTITDVL